MKLFNFICVDELYNVIECLSFEKREDAIAAMHERYDKERNALECNEENVLQDFKLEDECQIIWEEDDNVYVYSMHIRETEVA